MFFDTYQQTPLMNRIIQQLRLRFSFTGPELPSNSGVPDGDRQSLLGGITRVGYHGDSPREEGTVRQLSQGRVRDHAFAGYLGMFHQHMGTRNSNVGELDVAVIYQWRRNLWERESGYCNALRRGGGVPRIRGKVAGQKKLTDSIPPHLFSDISNQDSRSQRKRLNISQLHNKRLDTMFLPLDDQLGEYGTVSCSGSGTSDPPFGGTNVGSVDDEFVGGGVESGCRFETGDVGAVGEF